MATKYASAALGTRNWSDDTGTWVTASGGAVVTTHPIAGDTANLDANSGNVTIDVSSAFAVLNCTGYTGTLTKNADITTTSTLTFVAGMTFTDNSGTWTIAGTTYTITSAAKTFLNVSLLGAAGTKTLTTDLIISGNFYGNPTGNVVFATGNIQVGGNLSWGTTTYYCSGTNFILTGTGLVSCASNNSGGFMSIIIQAGAGTITFDNAFYISLKASLTYVSGTVINTGSTIRWASLSISCTLTDATNTWVNFLFPTGNRTLILSQATTISGNLTYSHSASTGRVRFTTNSFTVLGSVFVGAGNVEGTQNLILGGTGTFCNSAGGFVSCPIVINTAGTITLSGNIYLGNLAQTITYIAGTVVVDGTEHLFFLANNISISASLPSTLTVNRFTLVATQAGSLTLDAGKTLTVTGLFVAVSGGTGSILSGTPGTRTTINVTPAPIVPFISGILATDIDSSGGKVMQNYGGTNSNTVNWTTAINRTTAHAWAG